MSESKQVGDYRSMNKLPTALGIERRLCILIGVVVACYFQITGHLLYALAIFSVMWGVVYLVTLWEPRILLMLREQWQQKARYCPKKYCL